MMEDVEIMLSIMRHEAWIMLQLLDTCWEMLETC